MQVSFVGPSLVCPGWNAKTRRWPWHCVQSKAFPSLHAFPNIKPEVSSTLSSVHMSSGCPRCLMALSNVLTSLFFFQCELLILELSVSPFLGNQISRALSRHLELSSKLSTDTSLPTHCWVRIHSGLLQMRHWKCFLRPSPFSRTGAYHCVHSKYWKEGTSQKSMGKLAFHFWFTALQINR